MNKLIQIIKIYSGNIFNLFKISNNPFSSLYWILMSKLGLSKKDHVFLFKNKIKLILRKSSNDIGMLFEFYRLNPYHRFNDFKIKEDDIVFDLGANIGIFTLNAARKCTNGIVYSFEPMEDNFKYLNNNLKLNDIKNVSTFNIGISSFNGTKELNISTDSAFHSFVNLNSNKISNYTFVQCRTLTSLLDELNIKKINFLKVDIEGSEYDLIFSLSDSDFDKIDKIVFEVHPLDEVRNQLKLGHYLISKGFKTYNFNDNMLYASRYQSII